MASSLAADLTCCICLDFFEEPRMLRCGHNFCLSCLTSLFPKCGVKAKCPECRFPFKKQEFTCNRALANLAEKASQLQLSQEPLLGSALIGICKEHNEPLKLFCKNDLVPICVFCRNEPQHRRHVFLSIKSAVNYAKETLEPYQTRLGNSIKKFTKIQKNQKKKMAEMMTSIEEILSHISSECEVFHKALRRKEKDLKMYVEEVKTKNMEEVQDALCSLQGVMFSHTVIDAQIKTAVAVADNFAFLKVFKPLADRVKEFQPWMPKGKTGLLSRGGGGGWRRGSLLRRGGRWRRGNLLRRGGGWRHGSLLRRGGGGWGCGSLLRRGGGGEGR